MGKTTARRSVFQETLGFGAFSSDHAARLVMEATRTPTFSVEDEECWRSLDANADVARLKTWAYLDQISALSCGPLAADGFGFYAAAERDALARALARWAEPTRVHYLHLVRPPETYNRLRAKRGWPLVDASTIAAALARFDLSFLDATVDGERALESYARGWAKPDG